MRKSDLALATRLAMYVLLGSTPAAAQVVPVTLADGGSHLVDHTAYSGVPVRVRNQGCTPRYVDTLDPCTSPGAASDLTVAVGAEIALALVADTSSLTITGGTVLDAIYVEGNASADVSDGVIGSELIAKDTSTVTFSDGSVASTTSARDHGALWMSGGTTFALEAADFSTVVWSGGQASELKARVRGTLVVVGSDFNVGINPRAPGPIPEESGTLSGTLDSGDPFVVSFERIGDATLLLAASAPPFPPAAPALHLFNSGAVAVVSDASRSGQPAALRNAGCGATSELAALKWPCDSPGAATSLDIVTGGELGALTVLDASNLDMSGGVLHELSGRDFAGISISGGEIRSSIEIEGFSTLDFSGGSITSGDLPSGSGGIVSSGTATAVLNGGTANWLLASGESEILVTACPGLANVIVGDGDSATLTFAGSDFEVDAVPHGYGIIGDSSGTLTGTLDSPDCLNTQFEIDGGTIVLAPPTPAAPVAPAHVVFDDGGTHVLADATYQSDILSVRSVGCGSPVDFETECASPGSGTDLSLESGGTAYAIGFRDMSEGTIDGGSLSGEVGVSQDAHVEILAGSLTSAYVSHAGHLEFRGGTADEIGVDGIGTYEVYSGATLGSLVPGEFSDVLWLGGDLTDGLFVDNFARVRVFGGVLTGDLEASGHSRTEFFGPSFTIGGTPVSGTILATSGQLEGPLASGGTVNLALQRQPNAVVFLPEPSGAAGYGALLVAVLACQRTSRRARR